MPQRNKVIYDISNKPFADEHEFQVWLESQHGKEAFEPDLLRILKILKNLIKEISQNSKIITVCGTNGKGETVGFVSRFLSDEKKTFCSWTSPHILSLRERFISNNEMIKMRDFNTVIFKVMGKCNEERVKLSYYEFLFACFVFYTHQEMPEFILLEVGLGGRLDAVNIFDADLVLLTSISRDHQQFLGNRYDQILKEKLGVLRENKSLICGAQSNYINELSEKYAKSINSKFTSLLKTKKSYRD
ncbi:MAG: dihydrofolate synthase/folylpolyglutamate synthase, partial [Thermoproteota archaeon]